LRLSRTPSSAGDVGFVEVPDLADVAGGFDAFFGFFAIVFDGVAASPDVGETSDAGCGAVCAGAPAELDAAIVDPDGDGAVTTEFGGDVTTGGGAAGAVTTGGGSDVGAANTGCGDGFGGGAAGDFSTGSGVAAGTALGERSGRAVGDWASAFPPLPATVIAITIPPIKAPITARTAQRRP
jgi:hypothetical protein